MAWNNTTFQGGVEDLCSEDTIDEWIGFYLRGTDGWDVLPGTALSITDNSEIKDYIGRAVQGNKSGLLVLNEITLGDYNTKKTEIQLSGNFHLNLGKSNINGQVKISNDPWSWGVRASVKNTKIQEKKGGSTSSYFGLDMLNVDLGDFSEIKEFGSELRTTDSYCWINETNFIPLYNTGLSIQSSNNILFDLTDSHLLRNVKIENPIAFAINQNNFTSSLLEIENIDNMGHTVANNHFKSSFSIKTTGVQNGLKFLCNEFENTTSVNNYYNFNWQDDINSFQGYEEVVSSGNTFSDVAFPKIIGQSTVEIQYNYFTEEAVSEEPDPITHDNIFKQGVTGDAGCAAGASWDPFTGTVDPNDFDDPVHCPSGIDCTSPCPSNIDCTEDCPPGINCTEDCPLGINCDEPCPPGIDCTLPCPPGINCNEPCPSGIDCTQPCPSGEDCTIPCFGPDCDVTNVNPCYELSGMDGGPIPTDEVLDLVESQYLSISSELDNIHQEVKTYDYSLYDQLLMSSIPNRTDLIKNIILNEANPLIKAELVLRILDNSALFSEDEVVSIISSNAIVLYDLSVREIVFRSNSFSNANMDLLSNTSIGSNNSAGLSVLWNIDNLNTHRSRLIHYALYRMNHRCPPSLELENKWLERVNSFASKLKIADNFMAHQLFTEMNNYLSALSNSTDISTVEQSDAIDYRSLNNFMLQIKNSDRNLSELTESELPDLRSYAQSNSKFTASKAKNILAFHYDEHYGSNSSLQMTIDKIYFEKNDILSQIEENLVTPVKLSPNPVANVLNVSNTDGMSKLVLFNELGNVRLEYNLATESNMIDIADIGPGIYFYKIVSGDKGIVQTGKIIKLNSNSTNRR